MSENNIKAKAGGVGKAHLHSTWVGYRFSFSIKAGCELGRYLPISISARSCGDDEAYTYMALVRDVVMSGTNPRDDGYRNRRGVAMVRGLRLGFLPADI